MDTPPPTPPRREDIDHLNLLSVFHYVLGGIGFFLACFPLIHVTLGWIMVHHPSMMSGNHGTPPPAAVGYLFIVIGGLLVIAGWIVALLTVVSGWMISRRRNRIFSIVIAALLCAFVPFGTVLGVFTIIVLSRESVKQLYASTPA